MYPVLVSLNTESSFLKNNPCSLIYRQENCWGEELQVYNPGYEDLAPTGWNDKARSYNCAAL